MNQRDFRYKEHPNSDLIETADSFCKQLAYEMSSLRKEVNSLKDEVEHLNSWKTDFGYNIDFKIDAAFDTYYSDQIGLFGTFDFSPSFNLLISQIFQITPLNMQEDL